jgi:hypothetical protein
MSAKCGWVSPSGNVCIKPTGHTGNHATRRENVLENHTAEDGNPVGQVTSLPVVDEAGIAAARRYAGWHLGYRSWADNIVHAYLHPEQTNRELDAIQAP